MLNRSKRTLTLLVAAVVVPLMWSALSLSAPPQGKGGGGGKTVPGGPGLIAFNDFNAGGLITLINPDGTGITPVAVPGYRSTQPAWSPVFSDGTVKLAWGDSDPADDRFLTVVNVFPDLGGTVPIDVSDLPITERVIGELDWSPSVVRVAGETDSVRVAFIYGKTIDGEFRVYIIIANLIYDLEPVGTFIVDSWLELDPGPGKYNFWPRFSPDGALLALERWESGNKSIWLAKSDGTDSRPLIPLIKEPGTVNERAAWSPDGTKLAFISDRDGGRRNIYVASLVGDTYDNLYVESIERVTDKNNAHWSWLSWSPDGEQIAYLELGKGVGPSSFDVRKVILSTGKHYKLADAGWPDWSPALPSTGDPE